MKNLDLEKQVLSMLLMDADLLLESGLQESDFSHPLHKKLYLLVNELEANIPLIINKFTDDERGYVYEIVSCALSTLSFKQDVSYLKELTELRRIANIAKGIQLSIADGQSLVKIQEKLLEFEQQEVKKADMTSVLSTIVGEVTGSLDIVKYDSGFSLLDKYLWGFRPWQLIVVGARPAIGKTMFTLNLMLNQVEEGIKTAFFSLEMDNKSITQRILSRNSKLPMRAIMGILTAPQLTIFNQAIVKFEDQLKSLRLIDDAYTIWAIVRQIKYLKKKEGVQIVYIDYLGLIQGKGANKNLEIGNITRELKMLAMQLDIPIVLLAQLNRWSENRGRNEPILSDLRDSGSIEQDADMVVMLHRNLEETPKILKILIRKNRNWPIGELELACEPGSMQVGNLAPKPF